jgi:hypothetical protein
MVLFLTQVTQKLLPLLSKAQGRVINIVRHIADYFNYLSFQIIRGGQANFFLSTKIANPQIFTKYCTTLSQNSPKSRIFSTIYYFVRLLFRALYAVLVR